MGAGTPRTHRHVGTMAHRFHTIAPRNTTQAGYGNPHQKARREAAKRHQPTDPCARRNDPNIRCTQPLGPMGPWLHYDHDGSRTGYLGFSHGVCNRKAGAIEGNRRQRIKLRSTYRAQSRAW